MIVLDDPYIVPAPQHPNPERDITVISPDAIPEYVSELKAMDSSPSADERGGLRGVRGRFGDKKLLGYDVADPGVGGGTVECSGWPVGGGA
jgi:hypothetical protein